jgi:hypothetical protein
MDIGVPQSPDSAKPEAGAADSTFAGGLVGAGALPGDARMRLPREPYPGLRPFLDFEAALLFGRERQVREVIEGLSRSQFVAVLGGSGSGKSSLIHAGVVPELRSFGIPGAGDLWLPMTCTPGTNVNAEDKATRRRSPVTRLARRFARLLKSRGSEFADRARLDEIAEVFRQEAGFARLMDAYGAELLLPPGPDPEEARVLFVLDQFEEVFHPTNRDVADAGLLVERVLDHFFNPHPRCHVVITMRSEHLNDCAAFLELPDAINKSSYLIRRLDIDELRDAIVGPAQRFLRLVARSETSTRPLPSEVVFEPAVLQRLLRDVQAITSDPDHLPLLQHLLARLWEAALQREEMDTLVPATITEIDLVRAVNAGGQRGDEVPLAHDLNTLRACVNNWPESIYGWHDAAGRQQLDALLRRLAFKDPNTGAYSQQRVDVDDAARRLGMAGGRDGLRSLVAEGFLGSVDYLFWDDEDAARVTLKVSHESFIRGWLRFRTLVDTESVQFDEYLMVLRKCAEWVSNKRSEDFLLETGEMRRLGGSGFVGRTQQEDKRESWSRLLAMDRDAVHLAQVAGDLPTFIDESEKRLAQRRLRETRGRRSARMALAATVAFALLPTALFSWLVQGPTMRRAELLFEAGNRANQALLSPSQVAVGDGAYTLQSMLLAGALVDQARTGAGPWRTEVSKGVLDTAGNWPFFSDQRDFLDNVFMQAEPPVNGTLRQLIQRSVWRAPAEGHADAAAERPLPTAELKPNVRCDTATPAANPAGLLFVQRREAASDGRLLRALFVPQPTAADPDLTVLSASFDAERSTCTLGAEVLKSPAALNSSVVFDASLRLFYYTTDGFKTADGRVSSPATLIVQELDWERGQDGELYANRQTITSVSDAKAVNAVKKAAGAALAAVVPTYRVPGGRVLDLRPPADRIESVRGVRWFVANSLAQRVEPAFDEVARLQPLLPAKEGSVCELLARTFAPVPGFKLQVFEQGHHCFRILRGWPAAGAGESAARPLRDDVRIAVHERPSDVMLERARENPPAPLAALLPFARQLPPEASSGASWWVGTSGAWDGWLLQKTDGARRNTATGEAEARYIGAPWSTCALWKVGRRLLRHNPAPADSAQTAATLNTACRQP